MSDSDLVNESARLLASTARAHHEATGGANPEWARWYAEHLVDDLNEVLNTGLYVDVLEAWLISADRRYREEPQTESWPKVYAGWLVSEHHTSD